MSWDKAVIGTLGSVQTLTGDTRRSVGDTLDSAGAITTVPNPLRSHRMWDSCAYFLTANDEMAGSWTVTVEGTVAGIGNLPLASKQVDTDMIILKANGTSAVVLASAHQSPYSIQPDTINWDETAAGGITATVYAIAKTGRGQMHGGTLRSSTMVNEGVLACIPVPPAGRWGGATSGFTGGITQDVTIRLANTTATGTTTWFTYGGLGQNTVWDSTLYWMDIIGASGTWNIYIQGAVGGTTVTLASISSITGTTTLNGATKRAFAHQAYGCGIMPTQVCFDVTSTGVSQSIAGTIVYAAKTTKGVGRK